MIVPNLMVTDLARAVAFYSDVLGFELAMSVDAHQQFAQGELLPGAVFATLRWNGHELMLQTEASLAEDVPEVFTAEANRAPAGTVYLRGFDPRSVELPEAAVISGPARTWYGMLELYVRDPDGHVLCLGAPEGPSPA